MSRRNTVRSTNELERSIDIDFSNEARRHEGYLGIKPWLEGAESSEESEASIPGVTEDMPRRSRREREEPHLYSGLDYSKQFRLQENMGKTNSTDETR